MNINPRIARQLKYYYISKKLQGQTFTHEKMRQVFDIKSPWGHPDTYCKPVYGPGGLCDYIVRKFNLVQRSYALSFLSRLNITGLWQLTPRHITGTTLYVYYDNDPIGFYKLPAYGRKSDYLPDDIEECHISHRLKNRSQVVMYLKMIKQQNNQRPVQLKLFE